MGVIVNSDLAGDRIAAAVAHALQPQGGDRAPLYRALLDEPLAVCLIGSQIATGPTLRLEGYEAPTRLFESMEIGSPVVALFASREEARREGEQRRLWPDGAARLAAFEAGSVFPLLKKQPGALLMAGGAALVLDAGELAALAARMFPRDYVALLQSLVSGGRPREAARKLADRMFYVLGSPRDGMLYMAGELPVFLHLSRAIECSNRIGERAGRRPEHAMVAASELFQHAIKHKQTLLVDPGPGSFRLKPADLKI